MFSLAKIYNLGNQPENTIRYMGDIAKLKKGDLTLEEINLLFSSIEKLINKSKKSWEIVCSLEAKEIKNNPKSKKLRALSYAVDSLHKEVFDNITEGMSILDHHLIKKAVDPTIHALYLKKKADYHRITKQITPVESEKEIEDLVDKANKSYEKALELCSETNDLNVIKAGIILNYCVFLFEEKKDAVKAYKVANDFFKSSMGMLSREKSFDPQFDDLKKILTIIKANINLFASKAKEINESKSKINANNNENKEKEKEKSHL